MSQPAILIVEDEAVVAEDLAQKVTALGYRVLDIASTGEAALQISKANPPNLILLDIKLSGTLDGIETATRLKEHSDIPFLFLTAHSDPETVKRASACGAFGYVLKPFRERDLEVQLRAALYTSDRKQTERKLKKTEDLLLRAQRGAQAGVWEIDLRTDRITWSEPYYELFGIPPSTEPSVNAWLSTIHPEDRKHVLAAYCHSIKDKSNQNMEFRIVKPDGEIRWIHRQGQVELDEQGQPIRVNGISFDITERKHADEVVKAIALFPSQNPSPVLRISRTGILLYINPASQDLLRDLGLQLGQRAPSDLSLSVTKALDAKEAQQAEYTLGACHYLITISPVLEEQYANLYWTDISERKQVEEALRASEAQLVRELDDAKQLQKISSLLVQEDNIEVLYEQILDAAIGVMHSDMGSLQMLNPEGEALCLLAWKGFHPDSAAYWGKITHGSITSCGAALRTGERLIVPDVASAEFLKGSDHCKHYELSGIAAMQSTPLVSRDGCVVGMISTHWREPHVPGDRELVLLDVLARQAADVLERKRAEESIRLRAQQFETLLNQAPLGVYLIDADFRIAQVNPTAGSVFGNIPDLIGRDFDEVIHTLWHQAYADEMVAIFRHTLETGVPYMTPERIEPRLDRGSIEYYEWRIDRIMLPDGRYGVVCYFRDISTLVQAREALRELNAELEERVRERTEALTQSQRRLRALATELTLTEQRERKNLASDLHDHLQQLLVLGKLKLAQLKRVPQTPASVNMIADMDKALTEALSYTRTLVVKLSPPALRDQGLAAGLKWLEEYMRQYHLDVSVQVPSEKISIVEDHALLLFQSVRELLINCSKHAETSEAWVTAAFDSAKLVIEVIDKGKGFALDSSESANVPIELSSEFGLFSIRERMHSLGGTFHITSSPGHGTRAVLTLPLSQGERETSTLETSSEESPPLPF